MILETTSQSVTFRLAAAHTTTAPSFAATFVETTHASGVVSAFEGKNTNGVANGTTPVTAVAAPAAGKYRVTKRMIFFNEDTVTHTLTVRLTDGASVRTTFQAQLAPGEAAHYGEGVGWAVFDTTGRPKSSTAAGGAKGITGSDEQRVFLPDVGANGTFVTISQTAYFVYLGYTDRALTPKHVEFQVTVVGAGAETAKEVGLFSSPSPPSKADQTLTKLVSGATDTLVSVGVKRNTTPFGTSIAAGTHLWAGIRTQLATTQPTCLGLGQDMNQGRLLSLAAAGVFSSGSTYAGVRPAVALAAVLGPYLTATLD